MLLSKRNNNQQKQRIGLGVMGGRNSESTHLHKAYFVACKRKLTPYTMESFFDYYNLHKSSNDITDRFIKDPTNKICKFCGVSHPEVSFDTTPHIIPELFGRNNLTSNFECDTCNQKFQKFESDTSTMVQHYLSLLNIKTKNGVPTFQSIKKPDEYSTTLKSSGNSRNLYFGNNLTDFEFNDEEKSLSVKFRTRKFRPFSVYKIFLKMGISLLTDEELKMNYHYLEFLNSKEPIIDGRQVWTTFRYMLKTKYHLVPKVNLYKAKTTLQDNTEFPEFAILVNFANIIFQFFLPISKKNMDEHNPENRLRLELFPAFVLDDITQLKRIELYQLDLNEVRKVSITDNIVLHYDQRQRQTE